MPASNSPSESLCGWIDTPLVNISPRDREAHVRYCSYFADSVLDRYPEWAYRIQVVKGWLDEQGQTHEKVFNVVVSGQRKIEADGSVESVGSSVDVANASFTNTIGAVQLAKVCVDLHPNLTSLCMQKVPHPRVAQSNTVKQFDCCSRGTLKYKHILFLVQISVQMHRQGERNQGCAAMNYLRTLMIHGARSVMTLG